MKTTTKINTFIITLVVLGALFGNFVQYILPARAGVACTLPFTLANGQVADATQVMANYNALVTCLGNAASAGVNSDINTLSGLTTPLTVAQGGTGRATQTNNGITYFDSVSGQLKTDRCFMTSPGNTISCSSASAFNPQFVITNTTADSNSTFILSQKNRSGGNTLNGDTLGTWNLQGWANGTQQNAGSFFCQQSAASVGSNIPSTCQVATSDQAGAGQLNVNFKFPTTNGVSGQALTTDGAGNTSWGKPAVDTQVFTTTGANTWTRPAGVTYVFVKVCAGGGGGGGGARQAASTAFDGGGGGGGGYCSVHTFKATDAGASQTVTIGTGGTAGAGATTNGGAGTAGGVGGTSSFGSLLAAQGGGGGAGGGPTAGNVAGGGGGGGNAVAGTTGSSGATNAVGGGSQFWRPGQSTVINDNNTNASTAPCAGGGGLVNAGGVLIPGCPYGGGGGGGSGVAASSAADAGGNGADATEHGPGGGGGGQGSNANLGAAGGNGGRSVGCPTAPTGGAAGNNPGGSTAATFNYMPGCGGGGGGASSATAGGAGGNGTNAGGGGGGGGGDAVNGGAGGTGGNGFALVVSW